MASRRWRIVAVALAAIGAVLWVLAVVGHTLDSYPALRPWFGHVLVFAFGGCVAYAAAWPMLIRTEVWAPVGTAVFAVGAVVVVGLAGLAWLFDTDSTEVSRQRSPDGGMQLIVYTSRDFFSIDPMYVLRVETGSGLFAREVEIGCVNLDVSDYYGARWTGPRRLQAMLAGDETFDIVLDERGEPDRELRRGC